MKTILLASALLFATSTLAIGGSISIADHTLSDWGLNPVNNGAPANGGASDWSFGTFSPGLVLLNSTNNYAGDEDFDDTTNTGTLGPNSGGQNYDTEMFAVAADANFYYFAISTGQRPDNGASYYSPGDIHLETLGGVEYGIEVGGGPGGLLGGPGIEENAPGTTYALNANGYTTGSSPAAQLAGAVMAAVNWYTDPISPGVYTQVLSGVQIGTADYYYSLNAFPEDQHAIIELSVARSLFGGDTLSRVGWAPSCGNDETYIELGLPPTQIVPLPGAVGPGLLGLGLFAGAVLYRRRRRRQMV